ncbi:MAG: stalk domain-containing protein [Methylocystaceae bacterium]
MKRFTAVLLMVILWATPCYAGTQLDRGVSWENSQVVMTDSQPNSVNYLKVNLADKKIEIKPVLAQNKFAAVESLSQMAATYGAIGGINGTFFNMKVPYTPIDDLVQEGKLLSMSPRQTTALVMTYDNRLLIDKTQPEIYLNFASGNVYQVGYVNRTPGEGVVLYTPEIGTNTNNPANTLEATLEKDTSGYWRITGVYNGSAPIPLDGYVLSLQGSAAMSATDDIMTGSKLSIQFKNMTNIRNLWACGPGLVKDGALITPLDYEELNGSIVKDRNPRSAVGLTANNELLLVTVDGRQEGISAGMTFEELAELMLSLGAVQAMALDGGGSTELWAGKQVVNNLILGQERPVMNGLLVISQMPVYVNSERLYFDVPPVIEQGRTLLPVRKIMEKMGAEVNWDQEKQTVAIQSGSTSINLKIGDRQAIVNNKMVKLDVPPKVVDGRTMIPIRFISENLGYKVQWDAPRERVYIAQ